MSELGLQMVDSVRRRIGAPFRHHFEPDNLCLDGTETNDSCMERGMDAGGYDCSGLVIASLCDVLGITTERWPRELRHAEQLMWMTTNEEHSPGDVRVFMSRSGRPHVAIASSERWVIQASGITKAVEQGVVKDRDGAAAMSRTIALDSLVWRIG